MLKEKLRTLTPFDNMIRFKTNYQIDYSIIFQTNAFRQFAFIFTPFSTKCLLTIHALDFEVSSKKIRKRFVII